MGFVTRILINMMALWLTVLLGQKLGFDLRLEGQTGAAVMTTFVMVLILSVVNATIRPLVKLLTTPLNCLTLGLLSFVINALMFLLASAIVNKLGYGFRVGGFLSALFASVVMSIISAVATSLVADREKEKSKA